MCDMIMMVVIGHCTWSAHTDQPQRRIAAHCLVQRMHVMVAHLSDMGSEVAAAHSRASSQVVPRCHQRHLHEAIYTDAVCYGHVPAHDQYSEFPGPKINL